MWRKAANRRSLTNQRVRRKSEQVNLNTVYIKRVGVTCILLATISSLILLGQISRCRELKEVLLNIVEFDARVAIRWCVVSSCLVAIRLGFLLKSAFILNVVSLNVTKFWFGDFTFMGNNTFLANNGTDIPEDKNNVRAALFMITVNQIKSIIKMFPIYVGLIWSIMGYLELFLLWWVNIRILEMKVLKKYKWGYLFVTLSKDSPKTYKNLTNCSVTVLQLVLKKSFKNRWCCKLSWSFVLSLTILLSPLLRSLYIKLDWYKSLTHWTPGNGWNNLSNLCCL